jgi:hypothetical protein
VTAIAVRTPRGIGLPRWVRHLVRIGVLVAQLAALAVLVTTMTTADLERAGVVIRRA